MKKQMMKISLLILFLISLAACTKSGQEEITGDVVYKDDTINVLFFLTQTQFNDEEYGIAREIFEDNGFKVTTMSTRKDITLGIYGMKVFTNYGFDTVDIKDFDAFLIVGGFEIALIEDDRIYDLIVDAYTNGLVVGAITEAPIALARSGILSDKKTAIIHTEKDLLTSYGAIYSPDHVVTTGRIVTASDESLATQWAIAISNILAP